MKFTTQELLASVQQYKLRVAGQDVWTPYWLNTDQAPFHLGAPLRGKGNGETTAAEARRLVEAAGGGELAAERVRELMIEHGLGVDCAGFVYHVLARVLAGHGIELAEQLRIGRDYVQEALRRYPERMRPELEGELPEELPLATICRLWDKAPADLTSVRRLVHVSRSLVALAEVLPGDFIVWLGSEKRPGADHIGLVTEVTPLGLVYWSSDHDPKGPGGVGPHELVVARPDEDVASQGWPVVSGQVLGFWRLQALDGA